MGNTPEKEKKEKDIKQNIKSINRDVKFISNKLDKINKDSLEQDKVCQCIIV